MLAAGAGGGGGGGAGKGFSPHFFLFECDAASGGLSGHSPAPRS